MAAPANPSPYQTSYGSQPSGPTYDMYTQEMLKRTGRAGSQGEFDQYFAGQPDWQKGINTSAEATAYGAGPAASAASPSAGNIETGQRNYGENYGDVNAWIGQQAGTPGINPSVGRDPGYWSRRIGETGGLRADNEAYWKNLMMRPEGAPENWSVGGGQMGGGGSTSYVPGRGVGAMGSIFQGGAQNSGPLFDMLMGRAKQGLEINPNDPVIKQQTDAYQAADTRSSRNYLSGLAERAGPSANIGAEGLSAAEKVGQDTGAFQGQLMQQELSARRQEIEQALSGAAGLLTSEQSMRLQEELSQLQLAQQAYQFDSNDQFRHSPLGS